MKIKIEVCAASVQSALTAQLAGADRVELCSSLELGGITPSAATIEKTREILDIEVYVLIRPRPGDFFYSSLEIDIIKREILFFKNHINNLIKSTKAYSITKSSIRSDILKLIKNNLNIKKKYNHLS